MEKKHGQGSTFHICHFCAKAFVTVKNYNQHFKDVHRNGDNFDCRLCDLKFIRKLAHKKHMKGTRENEFENDENHKKGKENITSQECKDYDRNEKQTKKQNTNKNASIVNPSKIIEEEIPPNNTGEAKVKPVIISFSSREASESGPKAQTRKRSKARFIKSRVKNTS